MKNKMIGKKLTLLLLEQSDTAYTDQFNIQHPGFILIERVLVKIIKTRSVPGYFDPEKKYKKGGLKAVSENGEGFTRNWNSYPSESVTPTYFWDPSKTRKLKERFVDAVQALNWSIANQKPIVTKKGKAVVIKGIVKCKAHKQFYFKDYGCDYCELELPPEE